MTRTCANCEFWHATDSVLEGQCRRNAPAAANRWTRTQSTDWCGEHRPRGSRVADLTIRGADWGTWYVRRALTDGSEDC